MSCLHIDLLVKSPFGQNGTRKPLLKKQWHTKNDNPAQTKRKR